MKVLVNGGLNLSELDGWWEEAYNPSVGWALGDGLNHDGDRTADVRDAAQLFNILERQVIPEFYSRDASGTPRAWVSRVRESMASLTGTYSANRSVRQYVEQCYLPAAGAYRARAENNGALGAKISLWKRTLMQEWPMVRFGRVGITAFEGRWEITVEVALGSLDPHAVRVEIYADPQGAGVAFRQEMTRAIDQADCEGRCLYSTSVPASRASRDYTARIRPAFPGVNVPLEVGLVLWER
jgi:starch phosphorylase